jgi:hypothetical protein
MRSRTYRLEAEGELSDELGRLFAGMSLRREHGNTVLMGVVRDQAELHGLLQRFADLGLTILSVMAVDRAPGTPTGGPGFRPRLTSVASPGPAAPAGGDNTPV